MNVTLFYSPVVTGEIIELSAEEAWHCSKVLRFKAGEVIGFTDGEGMAGTARLLDVSPRAVTAHILSCTNQPKRPFRLHLAIAPTKSIDRFEWFLEKATECGIEEITPIICSQSERTVIKPDRLHKILVAAMKQSQRAWLPKLHKVVKFNDFIKELSGQMPAFIAHCAEGEKAALKEIYTPGNNAMIMIGPEGDFTSDEIQSAMGAGLQAISLGKNRLRTETAALVACMSVNFLNGEL